MRFAGRTLDGLRALFPGWENVEGRTDSRGKLVVRLEISEEALQAKMGWNPHAALAELGDRPDLLAKQFDHKRRGRAFVYHRRRRCC